jgi:hypothetical protein
MFPIGLKHAKGRGRIRMVVQKQTVESEIQFQDREMLKILLHALYGQEFLSDGLTSHGLGSFGDLSCESLRGIDLPEPTGIPVAGCAQGDAGMQLSEHKFCDIRSHFRIAPKALQIDSEAGYE